MIRSHTAEELGEEYMSERAKTRTKYKMRQVLKSIGLKRS
jgi:hypothetical protein